LSDTPATDALLRTSLYEEHLALGARMVPFAGWEMPVQYEGIVEEHRSVRERSGVFDVSHMGRFEVHGAEAATFLRYLNTWDVTQLGPGQGHYSAMCREDGGILDDVYIFCLSETRYLVVVNASNADKIGRWVEQHSARFDARIFDRHVSTAMIAAQGPRALGQLAAVIGDDFIASLKPRRCSETDWRGHTLFASRTGYTGEDGLELVIEAEAGPDLWRALIDLGFSPIGLGARDTLRLEAALLLYGNDMDEDTNPLEVGLDWIVDLDDSDFIGKAALAKASDGPSTSELVCLKVEGRGIMRSGCAILHSGETVGKVTSGGYSPTLSASIGMGFVPPELAEAGTDLRVEVRGKQLDVRVVPRPFYKRPKTPRK
jgi:aminomethyltransferase